MRRPIMLWPLIFLLLFLGFGGITSGIPMLADPENGGFLQFAEILPLLPVSDLILPGLFLLTIMGLFPFILAYALIKTPEWEWVQRNFQWSKHYWAWTGVLILVGILAAWLIYEVWLIGWFSITAATTILGALILFFTLLPGVRKFYTR
ncbi:MAG: hypothetical protein JEZ06_09130 [Anaerolineaceae bacterium]|nr:hypothetical protein [Anaerolineaceae bacterium]